MCCSDILCRDSLCDCHSLFFIISSSSAFKFYLLAIVRCNHNIIVQESEIDAVVKVTDSHVWRWGSIFGKRLQFSHSLLKQGFIDAIRGFPLTNSLLLDYRVKQYIHKYCTPVDITISITIA